LKNTPRTAVILTAILCLRFAAQIPAQTPSPGLAKLTGKDTPLKKGLKIAFFGDSVTDQGGYIRTMDAALKASANTKELDVQLLKHGLNGGRVPTVLEGKSPWGNLGAPMESLLEKEKPNVVVIYLGINDVWHGEKGTTKPDYEAGLKKMVAMCRQAGAIILLCTPTIIGEELEKNALNDKLGEYAAIVRRIASKEKLACCDLHKAFLDRLVAVNKENKHYGHLTYDGVHMNVKGNTLLADQIAGSLVGAIGHRK
jgi:isoamyl acetate esterase